MNYEYLCKTCNKKWEESRSIDTRDEPTLQSCSCGKNGTIVRILNALSINYSGFKSPIRRAGSNWNDLLKKIKKGSGKDTTIETH
jgi:hypothetical protein